MLKWSSLLQRHHKLGADKSCWKRFQSGRQFCHCFFSSALRETAHLAWKSDAFLPLFPWMVWLPIFHKVKEWRSRAMDLSAMTRARFSTEPQQWPSCSEGLGLNTEKLSHTSTSKTTQGQTGPPQYLELSFTAWQNILSWKEPTRIIQLNSYVNSPYRDRTHNIGTISTMLWPTELILQ